MAMTDTNQPLATGSRPIRATGEGVSSDRQAAFTVPGMERSDATEAIEILGDRLVGLLDLQATLKHIHWNVVGAGFIGVHEMLDAMTAGVLPLVDQTAERIATLGGSPNGLPGHLVAQRTWDDYDVHRATVDAHLAALDLVYDGLIADARDSIDAVESLDIVSHDLLVGHAAILEQQHWFVRAHLEDPAGGLSNAGATTELDAATKATNRHRSDRPRRNPGSES